MFPPIPSTVTLFFWRLSC